MFFPIRFCEKRTMATLAEDQTAFLSIVGDVLSFDDFVVFEEPDLLRLFTANPVFNEFKLRAIRNRARVRDQGRDLKYLIKPCFPTLFLNKTSFVLISY
jgi:hypothetical protein